jgi:TonB-dependent starch-binding outer membrane protein SusC
MKKKWVLTSAWHTLSCRKILRIMKLYAFLFLLTLTQAIASSALSQEVLISLSKSRTTVADVLTEIEKKTDYNFVYNNKLVNVDREVSINVDEKDIHTVMKMLFEGTDVEYVVKNKHIVISNQLPEGNKPQNTQGQTLRGKVTDENNRPVIGATVVIKGTTNGTITNIDGEYSLAGVAENSTLVFSFIGMKTVEKAVSGKTLINAVLSEEAIGLEEVVAIGYGVQKKKLITGATVQVGGSEIQKLNTVDVMGAMQSQSPGVNIVQNSGLPGEGFKVTIRGLGTIGDASPLFVIDGIPGGNINNLNPSDIESIDILKDAASAAIYGSRAANGVILVTTRQGRSGKMTISYDGYYGVQNVYKMAELLNAQEYAMIMQEGKQMDGAKPFDFKGVDNVPRWNEIENGTWEGTNWLEEARNHDAPVQNHSVNLSGGNEFSSFSMGFSYLSQEGIIGKPVNPDFERYTIRVNSEHVFLKKDFDIIKIGENITYSHRKRKGIGIGDIYWNDVHNLLIAVPFMPLYNELGEYYDYSDIVADNYRWSMTHANPIAEMDYRRGQNITNNHALNMNGWIEIQPIRKLIFRSVFGSTMSSHSHRAYVPEYQLSTTSYMNQDRVSQSMSVGTGWTWDNTLTYTLQAGNHAVDFLLGHSMQKSGMGEDLSASNTSSIFDDFNHAYLDNTPTIDNSTTQIGGKPWIAGRKVSFFGRANWNYNETYMATVILRADASDIFARGHRWGYFPSVSAGWILSNEAFLEETSQWLGFLKLRASYGQNGNDRIDPFQYLSSVSFSNIFYPFGADKSDMQIGAYADILPNEILKWETSEQLNIGFDSRFFSNKLGVSFDWYNKLTKDWLVQAPVLASWGTNAPYINGGDVQNRGYEVAISWNDQISDFTYGVKLNLAHNKNEVLRIDNSEGIIHGRRDVLSQNTDEMYRAQVGYPIGYFYGYQTKGVFQSQEQIDEYTDAKLQNNKPGDLIFVNQNEDNVIDQNDKVMIGQPHPLYNIGINISLGYKGFDLMVATTGAFGHQIAKSYRSFGDNPLHNYTTDILKRWHGEGTSDKYPRVSAATSASGRYISDIYIEDGDYVRIQNLTIGYDFTKLFPRLPFGQLRFYLAVQNLYTFTNYSGMDPEIGYGDDKSWVSGIDLGFYPSPRTIMAGVNIKF